VKGKKNHSVVQLTKTVAQQPLQRKVDQRLSQWTKETVKTDPIISVTVKCLCFERTYCWKRVNNRVSELLLDKGSSRGMNLRFLLDRYLI